MAGTEREGEPGSRRDRPSSKPAANGPAADADPATPGEAYAALLRDLAGLEEVCRWQWNLIRRVHGHLDLLPDDWPAAARKK